MLRLISSGECETVCSAIPLPGRCIHPNYLRKVQVHVKIENFCGKSSHLLVIYKQWPNEKNKENVIFSRKSLKLFFKCSFRDEVCRSQNKRCFLKFLPERGLASGTKHHFFSTNPALFYHSFLEIKQLFHDFYNLKFNLSKNNWNLDKKCNPVLLVIRRIEVNDIFAETITITITNYANTHCYNHHQSAAELCKGTFRSSSQVAPCF